MGYGVTEQNINFVDTSTINLDAWIFFAVLIVCIFLAIWLARKIVRTIVNRTKYHDHVVYLVRLPKEKPGENQQAPMNYVQQLHEKISQGETIFSAVGGLRAQRGFKAWLFGRTDHFSFEIVAHNKLISFYVVAPRSMARYMEQQIHANYSDAVMEEVEDYNIFDSQSQVLAAYIKTRRDFIFPIKTYTKAETDPLNSIVNVMSKLEANEGMALQFTVRSAKGKWHRKIADIVRRAIRLNSLHEALGTGLVHKILVFLGDLAKSSKPNNMQINQPPKRLTAMEEEMLKGMEAKNAKAGLDVNLRVIVCSKDKAKSRVYLDNMISAFNQYNYYEYGNILKSYIPLYIQDNIFSSIYQGLVLRNLPLSRFQTRLIRDFIYRRFDKQISFLLNTEELTSMYHLPLKDSETPNILWLLAKQAPAPTNIPDEGIIIGTNVYRGEKKDIKIKRIDRRRHMYVLGKSGGGKSQFIANMAIQDILNGEGVCVLDPHGDLIEDIISRVPSERAEDVIVFSPHDLERPMALNLIEYDPRYPEQKTFVINELIGIFDKLYDLKQTGGPIFEQYMRNSLLLIMDDPASGSTLMEVPKVLSDPKFRRMKLDRCKDPTVVDFWRKEAEKAGGDAALANIVPYITSKLTTFISNDMMRPIIGQQNSSFNLRDIMDNQKILLVDLPKGVVGELNAYLLGMIMVGKILMAALSRSDIQPEKRKDFYLYIDEFQNFTTNSICQILSEARKYALNLTIAHQYIGQMVKHNDTSVKDAVFGNVGTMVTFRIGSEDAQFLEKELSPVFNQYDLLNISNYTTYVKLLIDNAPSRPFSMLTPWPIAGIKADGMSHKIRSLSRLKFGRDKNIVEAEILKRGRDLELV